MNNKNHKEKNPLCVEITLDISKYLRRELSESKMEQFSSHMRTCSHCSAVLKQEQAFEAALKKATEEEIRIHANDDISMKRLETSIIESIKVTRQEKSKHLLETDEREKSQSLISISRLLNLIPSKPLLSGVIPAAIVIFLLFAIYKTVDRHSPHKIKLSENSSINLLKLQMTAYNRDRNISSLYGYNSLSQYSGYLAGLAIDIEKYNSSLQKTILHRLDSIKFSRKRIIRRDMRVSGIIYR